MCLPILFFGGVFLVIKSTGELREAIQANYEEYLEQLNTASPAELQSHLDWLDVHFFARHPGYEGARMMIERFLVTHGGPLH